MMEKLKVTNIDVKKHRKYLNGLGNSGGQGSDVAVNNKREGAQISFILYGSV